MKRLPHAEPEQIFFRWNGARVEGRKGDTVAAALYALGIRDIARSRKNHRPLGLSGSYVSGVLGRVDGRPNVRLDFEPVREGLDVRRQNVWPTANFDLLSAARLIPSRWLRSGFEHTRLMPSGTWRFQIWELLLAYLAGMAAPPDRSLPAVLRTGRRVAFDTLVVGGGPAGRRAANDAAAAGRRVALVSRGQVAGRYAAALGAALPDLDRRIKLYESFEIFGLYRGGTLAAGAPRQHEKGATVFDIDRVVLATGRRSVPPLVPGNDLPGILDAHAAMSLAHEHGVAPGNAVAVLGTGAEQRIADRLRALGVNVVHTGPVAALRSINGTSGVKSLELPKTVACDAVIHAGPWRSDPGLLFQASAEGLTRLQPGEETDRVVTTGDAAASAEPVVIGEGDLSPALICPCMDGTAGELLSLIDQGKTDPEVLKRLTACGMGPCQGMPCWEVMAALIAKRTGRSASAIGRPSHRPPRAALTVAQAAGLDGLVEPER